MARPINEKLNYFSLNVDFFDDPKVLMIEEQFGIKGGYLAVRLLCFIYSQGYFVEWSDELALVFAKRVGNGITHALVNDVVGMLLKRNFLNEVLFERYKILTSAGIQRRWLRVIHDSKRKSAINSSYDLISSEETTGEQELTTAETEETTHSKVKKRKESKVITAPQTFDLSTSNLYRKPVIPSKEEVLRTFLNQGGTEEMCEKFYANNSATGWYYKNNPIMNFANLVPGYISNWKSYETEQLPKQTNGFKGIQLVQ